MKQNTLNEVIDLIEKNKLLIPGNLLENPKHADIAINTFRKTYKQAVCFSMDYESAIGIKTIPELVKLPYMVCWFESVSDDIDFVTGYFCVQMKDNHIHVLLFQKYKNESYRLVAVIIIEDGDSMTQYFGVEGKEVRNCMSWLTQSLSALNCCNIKRIEHKPKPSQQSVRRALGRHPLFSTWTLEIDLVRSAKEIPGEGGTHASPRLHLRRGHARQHKPGHWCWVQACVVGDKALGMIHKDYAAS